MSVLTESKTAIAHATVRPQIHHDVSKLVPSVGALDSNELIRQISRFIKRETNLGVRELHVSFVNNGLILHGHCQTYYTKQLAQHAALAILGNVELVNDIRIVDDAIGENGKTHR